jgi:hypothetical protein
LSYPVIVCNDFANFFAVDIEKEEDPRSLVDSFVFEINYAYQSASGWSATEYFLVDVVSLAGLPRLLKSIEDTDVTLLGNHLSVT